MKVNENKERFGMTCLEVKLFERIEKLEKALKAHLQGEI